MSEGIKLYKHFTEQLGNMGKVKRAWFTTFNLDISFFEKYIIFELLQNESIIFLWKVCGSLKNIDLSY